MEFKGSNQPTNTNHVSQPHISAPAAERKPIDMMHDNGNKKWMAIVGTVVAIVVVLGVGWMAWNRFMGADGIKSAQYQGVFLTNGQVYFCKLSNVNDKYVLCNDIYYLQVQQSVQPDAAKKDTSGASPQVSLAKLGSELHGPEDQMYISRDQILFWENLKDNGKVVDAIKKNQQQK
jgi:hypothetical protein